MPGILNFTLEPGTSPPFPPGEAEGIYRGDTWIHELTFTDADGEPFIIEGEVTAQLRTLRLNGAEVSEPLAEAHVTVDGNHVTMMLLPEQTVNLPPAWVWDIQQIDGIITTTFLTGDGRTFDDVTRPNQ